jgi:hypothetical protein
MWQIILIVATILAGAQLWRMGGDGIKWARTFALPCLIALAKFILVFPNWLALVYAPALMVLLALFSYGISAPPHMFWVWVFGGKGADGNYIPVELCTRATCGFFWSLAAIPFAFLCGNWMYQIGYTVFLTIANAIMGVFVTNVELSERGVGASVSTAIIV